jgi:hypothetical protein
MSGDPKKPKPGELAIDATDMAGFMIDLPEGGKQGLRFERENLPDVLAEITANQPQYGGIAGVTDVDYKNLIDAIARVVMCDSFLPAARKLVELLEETRCVEVDKRERIIDSIAESVERRDKMPGNAGIAARYQLTREYRSAIGLKSAKTRKKNEAEKADAEKAKAQGSTVAPPPPAAETSGKASPPTPTTGNGNGQTP